MISQLRYYYSELPFHFTWFIQPDIVFMLAVSSFYFNQLNYTKWLKKYLNIRIVTFLLITKACTAASISHVPTLCPVSRHFADT